MVLDERRPALPLDTRASRAALRRANNARRVSPVSILVPCHNEEAQAEETFGALAAIDYPDFEIVAINDGSTDRTAEILDSLATRIPNLRVVHLAQNQGKSTALNVGALLAKGEILVGTDGDALLDRHALIWFVRRFQGDARIGGVTRALAAESGRGGAIRRRQSP